MHLETYSSSNHHEPGSVLDQKYEIRRLLGRGASGSVYLARHVFMDRNVAIKILHPTFAADDTLLARFHREAQLTSRLLHPNIITVHDFGVFNGLPYLVMEYSPGITLRHRMEQCGPLSRAELLDIVIPVTEALCAAHATGIVHRDLKPENVMLTETHGTCTIRVLDFGIAKLLEGSTTSRHQRQPHDGQVLTEEGIFQGTPRYASPEQIRNNPLDGRADVYALGIMMYEVLCGTPPFAAPGAMDVILQQLNGAPVPLHETKPDVDCDEELEQLILRCMSKSADERHDAPSLLAELRRLRGDTTTIPIVSKPKNEVGALGSIAAILLLGVAMTTHTGTSVARTLGPFPTRPTRLELKLPTVDEQHRALFVQGQQAYKEGQYNDAAAIFRSVLRFQPTDETTKLYLGLSYKKLGRMDEAVALLETLDPSTQESEKVAYQLALLNAKIGKLDRALEHLEQAVAKKPELRQQVRHEAAFKPLASNPKYRELVSEPSEPSRSKRRRDSGDTIERRFGRMLESMNHGLRDLF